MRSSKAQSLRQDERACKGEIVSPENEGVERFQVVRKKP
jgi:hypothetical protein